MQTGTMNKKTPKWKFFSLITSFCMLIAAPPLIAQDYGGNQGQSQQDYQQQYQQQQQQQQKDFSSEALKKFVQAKEAVDEVRSAYAQELGQTKDSDKARELQSKYQQQMVEAIQETGLSVGKYNEIVQAMHRDSSLRSKVNNLSESD